MTTPTQAKTRCPNCGQSVNVTVRTILDASTDAQGKALLLNGHLNAARCPGCGALASVIAPLLYHDSSKELLIAYVPPEMGFQQNQQERVVGDLLNALTRSIPREQFKAYLFSPRRALTLQGVIDQVLEADGITPAMMEEQKQRIDLIQSLLASSSEEDLVNRIRQNDASIDERFFQTLGLMAQRLLDDGRGEIAQALLGLQDALLSHSSFGRRIVEEQEEQETAAREVSAQLDEYGDTLTSDDILQLALKYSGKDRHLQALALLARPALEYQFFQNLTRMISKSTGEEKRQLEALRDRLAELTKRVDEDLRRSAQRSVDFLRYLLSLDASELDEILRQNANLIDDQFMAIIIANLEESERQGDKALKGRLQHVYERVIEVLQAQMTPELRFLNQLMSIEDSAERQRQINQHAKRYGAALGEMIDAVQEILRSQGQTSALKRLDAIRLELAQANR